MAKGLDSEFLAQLKSKNDIVEVIGSYVSLERKARIIGRAVRSITKKHPPFPSIRSTSTTIASGAAPAET